MISLGKGNERDRRIHFDELDSAATDSGSDSVESLGIAAFDRFAPCVGSRQASAAEQECGQGNSRSASDSGGARAVLAQVGACAFAFVCGGHSYCRYGEPSRHLGGARRC